MKLGDEGLEPPHVFGVKNADRVRGDAESDASAEARGGGDVLLADDDAGLAAIVAALPKLSADALLAVWEFVDRQLGVKVGEAVATDREA